MCVGCPDFEWFRVHLWEPLSPACPSRPGRLRQISKWLPQIEQSGWRMASGVMYGCRLPTGLRAGCVWSSDLSFLCVPPRPWSPDVLSGCKYNPWSYMAEAEWWGSLPVGWKSDSPRFVFLQPFVLRLTLSSVRVGTRCLHICSANDGIQRDVMQM